MALLNLQCKCFPFQAVEDKYKTQKNIQQSLQAQILELHNELGQLQKPHPPPGEGKFIYSCLLVYDIFYTEFSSQHTVFTIISAPPHISQQIVLISISLNMPVFKSIFYHVSLLQSD